MNKPTVDVLMLLADGHFHSGQNLAGKLNVSRTVIWKAVQTLQREFGLDIFAVKGRGYRLAEPMELFDQDKLATHIANSDLTADYRLHLYTTLDSTNQFLLNNASDDLRYQACMAEMQLNGRGRRGRSWVSPFGKNIQLSVSRVIDCSMANVSGLSIAIAAAVAEYLYQLGLHDIAIKWPNDLYVGYKKLGGLLLEVKGEAEGPVKVVIGLGLNLDMSGVKPAAINQPYTDLKTAMAENQLSRNMLAAGLIVSCIKTLKVFEEKGLEDFIGLWEKFDAFLGEAVMLSSAMNSENGIYEGIDEQGNLKLKQNDQINVYHAGEVSLRKML